MLSYLNPLPSLPPYRGPYKVGTSEFEIPISEISSTSNPPDDRISTIKFRLYYPTIPNATSKKPVYWLPEPQKEWNDAYALFMRVNPRFSSIISRMLCMWNFATLPAIKDAPLEESSKTYPFCIFSHGLGGNFNTYSSMVGNLASCGIFCVAPEHRDGSAPISFIKNERGEIVESIHYQRHSHSPTVEVLNARNAQLRVRLWELELTYAAIKAMNEGKVFTNYANTISSGLEIKDKLNLQPGQVTWAGHSFGAASITQFVKSVFYHQHLPEIIPRQDSSNGKESWDYRPLLKCTVDSDLVEQVTPDSPVVLLDLWTMPLRSETTKWLWERPMPSYYRQPQDASSSKPNPIAIMSAEFYKYAELLNRTRAVLSKDPVAAIETFERTKENEAAGASTLLDDETKPESPIAELRKQGSKIASSSSTDSSSALSASSSAESSRTPSPAPSKSNPASAASTQTSLASNEFDRTRSDTSSAAESHLYLVPQSAHLSQSDFGVLFPNLTKYVMKAIEPEKTLELNLRAILATMRGAGLPVESLVRGEDHILEPEGMDKKERWVRIPLVDV